MISGTRPTETIGRSSPAGRVLRPILRSVPGSFGALRCTGNSHCEWRVAMGQECGAKSLPYPPDLFGYPQQRNRCPPFFPKPCSSSPLRSRADAGDNLLCRARGFWATMIADNRTPASDKPAITDRASAVHRRRRVLRWPAWLLPAFVVVAGAAIAGIGFGQAHFDHHGPRPRSLSHVAVPALRSDPSPNADPPAVNPEPASPGTTVPSGLEESDPFLTVTRGRYFMYTSGVPGLLPVNVPEASSTGFTGWTPVTDAMPTLPSWAVPGYTWAPDVHLFGSTYVLYFTAMVRGSVPPTECIGDATSTSPAGPFTPARSPFICQASIGGSIDPRVFTDAEGTNWIVWKSDQNIGGASTPTQMWSQKVSPSGLALVGRPSVLMGPDEPWQGTIVEAPDMVELDGSYWLFYSGNWFNQPAYAIGAARCVGPQGPCADTSAVPFLASNDQGAGPGEESLLTDTAGIWMVYSPSYSQAHRPYFPTRPVLITRLGFAAAGPYLAAGGPPPSLAVLAPGSPRARRPIAVVAGAPGPTRLLSRVACAARRTRLCHRPGCRSPS